MPNTQVHRPLSLYDAQVSYAEVFLSFIQEGILHKFVPVVLCHEGKFYIVALKVACIESSDTSDTVLRCTSAYFIGDNSEIQDEIPWGEVYFYTADNWWETLID